MFQDRNKPGSRGGKGRDSKFNAIKLTGNRYRWLRFREMIGTNLWDTAPFKRCHREVSVYRISSDLIL